MKQYDGTQFSQAEYQGEMPAFRYDEQSGRWLDTYLSDGLILYLSGESVHVDGGNDTVFDASGTGNTGSVNNEVTFGVNAPIGQGFGFDGSNDSINILNSNTLNGGGPYQEKTHSIWVKFRQTDTGTEQVAWEQGGGSNGLNVYEYNGDLVAGMWSEHQGWPGTWFTTPLQQDQWYHVCIVLRNADTLRVYVDTDEIGIDNTNATQLNTHSGDTFMGLTDSGPGSTKYDTSGDSPSGVQPADCVTTEIRQYNRSLSKTEVDALYAQGLAV